MEHRIYKDHGVNFSSLSHLESIGLIHLNALTGYRRRELSQNGFVFYYGTGIWIGFEKPEGNEMQIGHVMLTKAGQQLAPICGSEPRAGFVDHVREKWKSLGYKIDQKAEHGDAANPSPPAAPVGG